MRSRLIKTLGWPVASLLSLAFVVCLLAGGAYWHFARGLPYPSTDLLGELHEPLRVYTADHKLIGVYGKQQRILIDYADIPKRVVQAFVAAEDNRFFEHTGVDYQGILRAAVHLLMTGRKTQGGSTITMQLARNLYLTDKRTYTRKIKEMIIALRLNAAFSKQTVFQLYANQIYLGRGAYGIVAAAHTYYGKDPGKLNLAQMAMLAGLPKAPSALNPIDNPGGAIARRNYVLQRMHDLGMIDDEAFTQALNAPVTAQKHRPARTRDGFAAPYVAEMVRQKMVARYGRHEAYTAGYKVFTTIQSTRQKSARQAMHKALEAFAKRHAWHGVAQTVPESIATSERKRKRKLAELDEVAGTVPAIVVHIEGDTFTAAVKQAGLEQFDPAANPWLDPNQDASDRVSIGDVVRVRPAKPGKSGDDAWVLTTIPEVQGALISMNPQNGAIQAIIGGYDFTLSRFNRAMQARRQPGSAFKPFLYSAALANGFTTATLVNDAPLVYYNPKLNEAWRPQNYSQQYYGPTRLRVALVHSRNLVSIRVLRRIGIDTAIDFITRFGLPRQRLPHNLTLALGTAALSPLQMARGYAVFANGGFLIEPYLIQTIRLDNGEIVYQAHPELACDADSRCSRATKAGQQPPMLNRAPRAIPAANAYLVRSMMHDVIQHGTGGGALVLGRHDLAGKTGTTDSQVDAWFGGFNSRLVTVCWVGFDQPQPMGPYETGAHAALPMWIAYMKDALRGMPPERSERPPNIVTVKIDPETGQRALHGGGIKEIFRKKHVPTKAEARRAGRSRPSRQIQILF